jgi:hypothetical protein
MVAAVGPNVKRIRVIDDILIEKQKGDIDMGLQRSQLWGLGSPACVWGEAGGFAMRGFGGMLRSSNIHVVQRKIGLFGPRFTCSGCGSTGINTRD